MSIGSPCDSNSPHSTGYHLSNVNATIFVPYLLLICLRNTNILIIICNLQFLLDKILL